MPIIQGKRARSTMPLLLLRRDRIDVAVEPADVEVRRWADMPDLPAFGLVCLVRDVYADTTLVG